MIYRITLFCFFLFFSNGYLKAAPDSLVVRINKTLYLKGEKITVDCSLPYAAQMNMSVATLNVWIEDLNKYRQWQFRYPIINGQASFDLVIDTTIANGKYAINFLVEDQFFDLKGKILDLTKRHEKVSYLMMAKNSGNVMNETGVDSAGNFRIKNLVFEDTANFFFSPDGAKKDVENDLNITIETPLDSTFTPVFSITKFVMIGAVSLDAASGPTKSFKDYNFSVKDFAGDDHILDEVVVKGERKTKVEEYSDKYVSGLFAGGDAKVFDGIENTDIANSIDIYTFLRGRVAGLQVTDNGQGSYNLSWRGAGVDIYLDQFKLMSPGDVFISPSDVAMIKVFQPPAFLGGGGSGGGGAIAIYTKRGGSENETKKRNHFMVRGFNPVETKWKAY